MNYKHIHQFSKTNVALKLSRKDVETATAKFLANGGKIKKIKKEFKTILGKEKNIVNEGEHKNLLFETMYLKYKINEN